MIRMPKTGYKYPRRLDLSGGYTYGCNDEPVEEIETIVTKEMLNDYNPSVSYANRLNGLYDSIVKE